MFTNRDGVFHYTYNLLRYVYITDPTTDREFPELYVN